MIFPLIIPGIPVPHSSPYYRQLSRSMVEFHSFGLAKHWYAKYTSPGAGECKKIVISFDLAEIDDEFATKSKMLCLDHFLKFIGFLLTGIGMCTFVLIGEKITYSLAQRRVDLKRVSPPENKV